MKKKSNKDRTSLGDKNDLSTTQPTQPKEWSFLKELPHAQNHLLPFSDVVNRSCGRLYGVGDVLFLKKKEEWLIKAPPPSILREIEAFVANEAFEIFPEETRNSLFRTLTSNQNEDKSDWKSETLSRLCNKSLRQWWWRDIAERYPSTRLYPYHEIIFDLCEDIVLENVGVTEKESDTGCQGKGGSVSGNYTRVASFIHRIVSAYVSYTSTKDTSRNLLPEPDSERLLSYTVFSKGYRGPQPCQKDTAFVRRESAEEIGTEYMQPTEPRKLYLVHYINLADHINVCCGNYYYRLCVIDQKYGDGLVPVELLANGLAAIYEHAKKHKVPWVGMDVNEEEKERRVAVSNLLVNLSVLHDDVSADLRRRLRDASLVNTYTLEQLESGLFTLVLPGSRPDDVTSQWMHSMLSFYLGWGSAKRVRVRSHATMISFTTLCNFLTLALGKPRSLDAKLAIHSSSRPNELHSVFNIHQGNRPSLPRGEPKHPWKEESLCTSLDKAQVAHYLELWLPLPAQDGPPLILPHAPLRKFSAWNLLTISDGSAKQRSLTAAVFCLRILLAAQSALAAESSNVFESAANSAQNSAKRPMVYLAMLHDRHTVPTLRRLYSPVIERFIQVHRSQSYVLTDDVRKSAYRAALLAVSEELQECFTALYPLSTMACSLAGDSMNIQTADVCVTLCVLPRHSPTSCAEGQVGEDARQLQWKSGYIDLAIPSRIRAHLCVQPIKQMKKVNLGECVCRGSEASHVVGEEEFANAFYKHVSEKF